MNRLLLLTLLLSSCSVGCVSIGGWSTTATMADEIEELEDLRNEGKITSTEFNMGKHALLSGCHCGH